METKEQLFRIGDVCKDGLGRSVKIVAITDHPTFPIIGQTVAHPELPNKRNEVGISASYTITGIRSNGTVTSALIPPSHTVTAYIAVKNDDACTDCAFTTSASKSKEKLKIFLENNYAWAGADFTILEIEVPAKYFADWSFYENS